MSRRRLTAAAAAAALAVPIPQTHSGEPSGGSGRYDLDDLIRLAIQNDPGLTELRGEVEIAKAEARAVLDFEDPELRLSYQRDHDVEMPRPVTETRRTSSRDSGVARETEARTDTDAGGQEFFSSSESENFDERSDEFMVREITPTPSGERIVEETRQVTTGSSRRNQSEQVRFIDGGTVQSAESASVRSSERVVGRTVEERAYDFNRLDPDSDFAVELRWRLPNPFERKPLLRRAHSKVAMAESLLRAGEHAVAIEVRKAYAELLEADAEVVALESLGAVRSRLAEEAEGNPRSDLEITVALADDAYRTELELIPRSADREQRAFELAALAGIDDPGAISLDSPIAPRRIDLASLDPAFLREVATAYRADIVELLHRATMSELELKAHNASKIPWFNFVEGFYGVDYDRDYRSADAFGVQVGISLPLFSWFKNSEHEIYERERDSYNARAATVRRRIHAEVDLAVKRLDRASHSLDAFERGFRERRAAIAAKLEEATTAGARQTEARYRAEESMARLGESRFRVLGLYNDAVLNLEAAIGTTLEDVFSTSADPGGSPAFPAGAGAGGPAPDGAAPPPQPGRGRREVDRPQLGAPHRP